MKFKVTIDVFDEEQDEAVISASAQGSGEFPSLDWFADFANKAKAEMLRAVEEGSKENE